jgi:hypothetical protein
MTIIEIGAEGGSIKVLRRTAGDGSPQYSVQLRDQTMTFLSEGEAVRKYGGTTPGRRVGSRLSRL